MANLGFPKGAAGEGAGAGEDGLPKLKFAKAFPPPLAAAEEAASSLAFFHFLQ
jgi:hypothetical protein